MRWILTPVAYVVACATIYFSGRANVREAPDDLNELARMATSTDPATACSAIAKLREEGPDGLQGLLTANADLIARHRAVADLPPAADSSDPKWQRLKTALDEVSGQRDCHASRLFWYTDLDKAKEAARREHKPILSLRLLGKLTDEYSCANSRFFRTTLYANDAISQVLRDQFILHWKSVRPVPKVTIDFGDGRKLQRTLTGNSIHYVLDSEGRVIEALPGLYGPKPFLRELERAEAIVQRATASPPENREPMLIAYHRDRIISIQAAWRDDLGKLGIPASNMAVRPMPPVQQAAANTTPAAKAGPAAATKWVVEAPMVTGVNSLPTLEEATSEPVWNRIAALHAQDGTLDQASLALIASQHPTAAAAAGLAISKTRVERPLVRMVRAFQGSIALDTVRNEYLFHRQIHAWLAAAPTPNLDTLNERVYAQLFLTPSTDPWLGLMPADTYTALENNGVVK